MSGNHTPTPWNYIEEGDRGARIVCRSQDVVIAKVWPFMRAHGELPALANADLIVTAVNSYASSQAEIERLRAALTDLLAANDAVQMVLCDGPEVPGFDPMALGNAQRTVTAAEDRARAALSGSKE